MLNRSLYEDMAIAHRVHLHPEHAATQFEKNEELAWGEWGAALQKHEAPVDLGSFPAFGDAERKDLARGFGGKTWTGLNLYELTRAIEEEWLEGDRRILWQAHDIVHSFNNLFPASTASASAIAIEAR
jgi:hypothetical protein